MSFIALDHESPRTAERFDRPLSVLADQVVGPVLAGDDPRVTQEVATFNTAVTHRPAVVVGATSAEDVSAAVTWAVANGLPVAVQATGHGPVQAVTDALLITTGRMDTVVVDPERRSARVGAGVRWSDVLAATAPHGLAGMSASSSHVGVVGFTLGGGMGSLSRQYGFSADNVREVEIVTADGRIRRVDASTDPDLFWSVRGGKANFGVVTALEVGLVPVTDIYAGASVFSGESAARVLHAFRVWAPTLPEQTTTSVALLNMPPEDDQPEMLRGKFVVMLRFAHNGSLDEGAELLAPMRGLGGLLIDGSARCRTWPRMRSTRTPPTRCPCGRRARC